MEAVSTYVVVSEAGITTKLAGDPAQSVAGASAALRQYGQRGYIARKQGGVLTMIHPLNDPTVSFEEVQKRAAQHGKRRNTSNASVFQLRTA